MSADILFNLKSEALAFDPQAVISLISRVESGEEPLEQTSPSLSGKVSGMSGRKFRTLMARLVGMMPAELCYLELGIFQGVTPLVVSKENPGKKVIGVDDFSQFDKNGENLGRINAAKEFLGASNLEIHAEDFEAYLKKMRGELARKVGIYYFDASHDYRSQMLALQYATRYVARGGIVVVDDCNYPHVRQATADMVDVFPEFKLVFEAYTGTHPKDMTPEENKQCRKTWWNGVHIIMHDPENRVAGIRPPLPDDLRGKFVKQHGFAGCKSDDAPTRIALVA